MHEENFGSPQAARLYAAARKSDLVQARQLLAEGVNRNAANAKGQTLLTIAMLAGDRRAFDSLLALGADPAYLGSGATNTPMHVAAMREDPYWLKTLLARGAPLNVRNALGETPLFTALLGPQDNVQLLLDAGADIHARNKYGETLLHQAAATMSFAWVPRFLELGVDPRLTGDVGHTFQAAFFRTDESLLNCTAKSSREKVRAWLRSHGLPVEERAQKN